MFATAAGIVVTASIGTGYWLWSASTENTPSKTIFGVPLEEIKEEYFKENIPIVMFDCLEALYTHVKEDGILRQSGETGRALELIELYELGERPPLHSELSHTISSFMKKYLTMLPEPLLTFALYEEFIEFQNTSKNLAKEEWCEKAQEVIQKLPERNRVLFLRILAFLAECHKHESSNRMTATNLGTVVAPSLCYPDLSYSTGKMISEISVVAAMLAKFISNYELIATKK